ncbi:MAG: hypothetical protein ACXWPS_10370 [Ktedonobacteraceae bacterium]
MPRLWFHHLHSGRHNSLGGGRLATLDRVEHDHAVRAKRGMFRLADRHNLRVVVVGNLVDELGQLRNECGLVEGVAQPVNHIVAREDPRADLPDCGSVPWTIAGCWFRSRTRRAKTACRYG